MPQVRKVDALAELKRTVSLYRIARGEHFVLASQVSRLETRARPAEGIDLYRREAKRCLWDAGRLAETFIA